MPKEGVTSVDDLIRGEVEWRNETLNDFIIMKSDGFPTYHLAVVADDHLMEISHIMRAEEWLPSTPRHLQLFKALGFEPPKFAHLPMIMGPDRAKLSKRHGATAIGEYKEDGILPEALLNFMVLLGWSLDDKTDVVAPQTVIDNFTLDRITNSSAIFDQDRLQWMNGMYIRELTPERLANQMMPFLQQGLPKDSLPVDEEYLRQIAPLLQQRMKNLKESADSTSYFFQADEQFDTGTLVQKGMDRDSTLSALKAALDDLSEADNFQHEKLEEMLTATGERLELSRRQFFGVLRVTATGRAVSPPLFEMMEVLGKDRTVSRIRNAIERFSIPN
jgi:glutamyl-tRNA synthetase